MTSESSGSADPAKTIALLWGTRRLPRRGPRHALSAGQVIATAIGLADEDKDLAQLSMRRVAETLGVGTMSLYTYVVSRAELVEAMLDSVYGAAVARLRELRPGDWRDGLRQVAAVNWAMYLDHPWMLQVFTGRPPLGPNAIAKYDLELRVVDGVGLTDVEMDAVVTLVHTHVEGVARRKVEAEQAERRTGITDAQWWEAAGPALAEVLDPGRFPVADRVGRAAGEAHQSAFDIEHEYAFGLDRMIEGVEALIRRSGA
ncbi:TetR/AcrR family transcriptional regulator C-terminal domain-containing protein [Catellatospora sp. KI3]|uniref:TetR/AcrR family transcriptional regulator n=1 Tax=Catellatospora sp. KI3 TaxID=3041620 RepID=UPI0024832774|nr:TetR/AcrR family transcriptional regulator C-terminal domain-containing protein [Catellatospora sp. KI3]MDI1463242.1 TetR/AcrR family transcriptional regulator C-terminal domain-containing protein [Catellatospora sp. KI3]